MYLMTSLEMIFFSIAFMFSPIFISGGGCLAFRSEVDCTKHECYIKKIYSIHV